MEKNKPILLVIAGPNGSGKTTVTTQILKHEWVEGCVYINPDNIAQEQFGDWNSPDAVLKAAKLATEQREKCRLYVYDNSVNYADARLLFRATNGSLEKIYSDVNDWAAPILAAIQAE